MIVCLYLYDCLGIKRVKKMHSLVSPTQLFFFSFFAILVVMEMQLMSVFCNAKLQNIIMITCEN